MKPSKLWEGLTKSIFANTDEAFLSTFREPGNANNRLAAWDPYDKSMRYFKFLLFNQITNKDSLFFDNYLKLGDTSLGNPVTLNAPSGAKVNLDHFFSIEEYSFLQKYINLKQINHVLEIGAGFGRTAQALIKLEKHIKKYTIIDLPEIISLSSSYLHKVLSEDEYEKLYFIDTNALPEKIHSLFPVDLSINIDSFQEMHPETIDYYFDNMISKSAFFYSKNAIGKYRPESVGLYNVSEERIADVFSLGRSTDIIDIFDENALIMARKKHVMQYKPSESFDIIGQEPLGIFPYYLNVIYRRGNSKT